ncbi:histidine kinase [Yokenella regensburgei]|uniref:biofilm development regulator YmgB/AriR family protein n=1 Tax=Yokenella regensburgei TaxID=158877 RepID=UPI003F15A2CF
MTMSTRVEFLNPTQTIRLPVYSAETAFIKTVEDELRGLGFPVSNKAVILAIIRHLEEERDPQRSALYRSALEMVVRTTPDDL